MTRDLIHADLSRGKKLTYLNGDSGGDLGVEFTRSEMNFDYQWYKHGEEIFQVPREKNMSVSDVINEAEPILIKTKNSERLDSNT